MAFGVGKKSHCGSFLIRDIHWEVISDLFMRKRAEMAITTVIAEDFGSLSGGRGVIIRSQSLYNHLKVVDSL